MDWKGFEYNEFENTTRRPFRGSILAIKIMSTVKIKFRDIPAYLREGEFYRSLDADDEDSIVEVSSACFKADGSSASTLADFNQLMRVTVFWVLDRIPTGVLNFTYKNEVEVWHDHLLAALPGGNRATFYKILMVSHKVDGAVGFTKVLDTCSWDVVETVVARMDRRNPNCRVLTTQAVILGNLPLLKLLHSQGFPWESSLCAEAARHGHTECLEYLHENGCPWGEQMYTLCDEAARNGHVGCLRYAHENGCKLYASVYEAASTNGHLQCLQYAFEQGIRWGHDICGFAARKGHFECLKFAHENGCPWEKDSLTRAVESGDEQCLLYALQNGCPMNSDCCTAACRLDNIAALQLLHLHGAPWDSRTTAQAARNEDIECLIYLYESGCPWDEETLRSAVYFGHLDHVRFALTRNCPAGDDLMLLAATRNRFAIVQYLLEDHGMYMDGSGALVLCALLAGSFECLQYLIDQGCPYRGAEFPLYYSRWSSNWDSDGSDSEDETGQWLNVRSMMSNFKHTPEFGKCVTLALERGWTPNNHFANFLSDKDEDVFRQHYSLGSLGEHGSGEYRLPRVVPASVAAQPRDHDNSPTFHRSVM